MDILNPKQNQKQYNVYNYVCRLAHVNTYNNNNREVSMYSVSKVESPTPELKSDPRLKSKRFRQVVRRVFEYLGIENTHGNFRKWNKLLDWHAIARSIDHPTRFVIYHTRGRSGEIIEVMGRPVSNYQEIVACSESEASEILARESKVFVRWSKW